MTELELECPDEEVFTPHETFTPFGRGYDVDVVCLNCGRVHTVDLVDPDAGRD